VLEEKRGGIILCSKDLVGDNIHSPLYMQTADRTAGAPQHHNPHSYHSIVGVSLVHLVPQKPPCVCKHYTEGRGVRAMNNTRYTYRVDDQRPVGTGHDASRA
jgi:hypothetical protein